MTKSIEQPLLEYSIQAREEVDGVFNLTLDAYHKMIQTGILTSNNKVELLFGQLIPKMPVGKLHAETVDHITAYFYAFYAKDYKIRVQNPVTLVNNSEPEPDVAIVKKKRYLDAHPGGADIELLIEVSDNTLRFDQGSKARSYALSNVREYWIVNIKDEQIDVYLQPDPVKGQYDQMARYNRGHSIKSNFCGDVEVNRILLPMAES